MHCGPITMHSSSWVKIQCIVKTYLLQYGTFYFNAMMSGYSAPMPVYNALKLNAL